MKILGLITARGGSKGIPGKNIKLLGGKPLISYTIESAKNSELEDVIVSTDSLEIAEISKMSGANVPFIRPAELATDSAKSIDVIQHAVKYLESTNKNYDAICLLQPTTPFREKGLINDCIKKFTSGDFDSLITVLPVPHEFNPHWIFEPSKDGYLKIATGEKHIISRRQDLPEAYFRDGSIYLTKTSVLKNGSLYGDKIGYMVTNPEKHINLDTPKDWEKAEYLLSK